MTEPKVKAPADFVLPSNVVTKGDVSRLVSDLERVDNELTSISVRKKVGSREQPHPGMSDQLADFLDQNSLELDDSHERTELIKTLRRLKDSVPVIHMTFASIADYDSLQKLVDWFRESVHPQAVIEVGLQPALIGGVYLRTPNHVHDFSLRGILDGQHDLLVKELRALRGNR